MQSVTSSTPTRVSGMRLASTASYKANGTHRVIFGTTSNPIDCLARWRRATLWLRRDGCCRTRTAVRAQMKGAHGRHWNVHLLSRLGLHGRQTKEVKMRKTIYMAAVAGLAVIGSINASYAAGAGGAAGAAGGGAGVGTGNSTGGSSTTGMGAGNTGNGMGNSAGGANAGANSLSNPSGNSLMPNSPGGTGTAAPRSGAGR